MARSLWVVFLSMFERGDGMEQDGADGDGQFIPSPLDLSVRFSHGGSETTVDRELSNINEQAEELEGAQRDS